MSSYFRKEGFEAFKNALGFRRLVAEQNGGGWKSTCGGTLLGGIIKHGGLALTPGDGFQCQTLPQIHGQHTTLSPARLC